MFILGKKVLDGRALVLRIAHLDMFTFHGYNKSGDTIFEWTLDELSN